MNNIYGDPQYKIYNAFADGGYDFGDAQLYITGSYGHRNASSYENFRATDKIRAGDDLEPASPVYPFPLGFSPREAILRKRLLHHRRHQGHDCWLELGFLQHLRRRQGPRFPPSIRPMPQLFPVLQAQSPTPVAPQRNFYDGAYMASEWTSNVDITKNFDVGLATPVNVAFGGE